MKIKTFESIIKERNITRLCHFTQFSNLINILELGILSSEHKYWCKRNDINRYDGHLEYVCTSVELPNMFYLERLCKEKRYKISEFVVIEIDPNIINKKAKFCVTNAARNKGKLIKSGVEEFEKIFAYNIGTDKHNIRNDKYKSCIPTDLQAEILIYKKILPEYIKGIIFHKKLLDFLISSKEESWNIVKELMIKNEIKLKYSTDYALFSSFWTQYWLEKGGEPYVW